ncbi:MAG: hypothetical protein IKU24_02645, partial [Clostridia bacterium]|nr:hypothetical protein [Clostridia bacterium]
MFAFTLSGIIKLLLSIILITSLGYGLGRITIKGVSLGTAGVFIVALLFGALFPNFLSDALPMVSHDHVIGSYASNALKII